MRTISIDNWDESTRFMLHECLYRTTSLRLQDTYSSMQCERGCSLTDHGKKKDVDADVDGLK